MEKRIVRTVTVSLTLLFAAATMSFAQESPSAKDPAAAIAPAAAILQPATDTKLTTAPATETKMTTAPAAEAKVAAAPSDAEMMAKMMELSKLNDNHKLLAGMVGNWSYAVKMWMDPKANPSESNGTAVVKAMMDGRFVTSDHSGKFKMPGADGKMKEMNFKGMALDGYDNVKQKFVSVWVDNMGTGVMFSDGTYDAGTKTFTYTGEYEAMPGMKSKVRQVVKVVDKDHHTMEYYEDRGQGEMKAMEISYTRKK